MDRLSRIAKQYDSDDKSYFKEEQIDRQLAKSSTDKTRVKCDCCNQTQFFIMDETLYIKCSRCRTERIIRIIDIVHKSSELKI